MKATFLKSVMALLLGGCALVTLVANAADAGGHLVIKPSPVLGDNVVITIRIDGELAGTLMPTGTFDRPIKPGRHVLKASPNIVGDAWQATLDVKPGQTYSYVAEYNLNKLVLTRMTGSH